ncbi:hypothetical protein N665_0447s0006 [Sinapis alba]|nr:hypothetical protein N665_0447s0006 [Sinapis alba]
MLSVQSRFGDGVSHDVSLHESQRSVECITLPSSSRWMSRNSVFLNIHHLMTCSHNKDELVAIEMDEAVMSLKLHGVLPESSLDLQPDPGGTCVWNKPPPSYVKCSVGASWSAVTLTCGVSWIVRDSAGKTLVHSRRSLVVYYQVYKRDLIALSWSAEAMVDLKFRNVRFEFCSGIVAETRWIQLKTTGYHSNFALGYQKNKSYHSYKILRCRDDFQLNNTSEIYEFGSDSWKCVGNTFWLARDRIFKNKKFVLSFNFMTERFKRFSLPKNPAYIMSLSVVRDEQLVLSMQCFVSNKMQVWVSNKIGNEAVVLSWSKSFKLDFPPFIFSYVPSLVHIQQD